MSLNENPLRKVFVFINLTLDGVMQAPGGNEEGFEHSNWAAPYAAMESSEARESLPDTGALLLGRRTYEGLYAYWPKQSNNPYTEMLNNMTKYVASRTLEEPLPWMNSILLKGEAAQAVAQLKSQPGPNLMIMGSGELIQSLMKHNLIDQYTLLIHPLVLGTGRLLFPEGVASTPLDLVSAKAAPKGVVVANYRPAVAAAG